MTQPATSNAPASFNLWDQPWIRVLALDNTRRSLSIQDVLTEAHTLKAFYDPSPLTVCGVHRLLAAILQAIYDPKELADITVVLDEGRFDAAKIQEFAHQHRARFDLFDPVAPFMQTGDVALDAWRKPEKGVGKPSASEAKIDPKSVAYLLAEVPTGTNRTHFRHVSDDAHRLCPACCARGLVTLPSFATSGGAGIKPSINGVPPVYILPVGDSLFSALVCSMAAEEYRPAVRDDARTTAAWNGATVVVRNTELPRVGYIESLTFAARRVRLFPVGDPGSCTRCGQWSDVRVTDMLYEMGQSRPKESALWKDPFVAYRLPAKAKPDAVPTPLRPSQGKALWRDYGALFLTDVHLQPGLVRQMAGLIEEHALKRDQRLRFRCIGMKTDGKAKVFEWLDDALNVPGALLQSEAGAAMVRQALERAEVVLKVVTGVFMTHAKANPNAKQERFATLRSRMEDTYWTALAVPFRNRLTAERAAEDINVTIEWWAKLVMTEAERVFIEAIEQLGERGEMLRRRAEGRSHCRRALAKYRKEWNLVTQRIA